MCLFSVLGSQISAERSLTGDQNSIVHLGKGSYAASIPTDADDIVEQFNNRPIYLLNRNGRPLPSNKWWTQLLVARYAKSLWTYPLRVETAEEGLSVCFPVKWNESGSDPVTDFPLTLGAANFKAQGPRVKDWSDWLVTFRMQGSVETDRYMDVTLGEGMPSVWIEYHGLDPQLRFPVDVLNQSECRFFNLSGNSVSLPTTSNTLGFEYRGRAFALLAPDSTEFQIKAGSLVVRFSSSRKYLVLCALQAARDIVAFHNLAYAVPRSTQFSWRYKPEKGLIETTWKVSTEALKGSETRVIQGWIPHHYRNTANNLDFNGMEYLSPRGKMKCSVGNTFTISFPYTGIVPNLPAPQRLNGPNAYDPARMHTYLKAIAAKPHFGDDTYWGGKDILRFGQGAFMAEQMGDSTLAAFRTELHKAMTDWYTYSPGKKSHYFARNTKWQALLGIKPSYGSEGFNDHHFHYGYFTFASALLAMQDSQFAADYGEMAKLVAKEYANWDRSDARFPFLRTMDIWAGHSWAGGTSSPGGENQESSSEAVQSWAGLVYLGEALGDKGMTEAGIMGYAMETSATMEYWFNAGRDVFPPEWKHPIDGMVWSGGNLYGTYFTGDPAWIYAIQWLPPSPMLSYLVRDRSFAEAEWKNMVRDYNAHEMEEAAKPENKAKGYRAKTASIKEFGAALGNVMLGYRLMFDPDWAAQQLDALWNEPGDIVAHNADEMAIIYYMAHSMKGLGTVDWSRRTSSPTSAVYLNEKTGIRNYVVWNPGPREQSVDVYEKDKIIGRVVCAPHKLVNTTTLLSIQ